MPKILIDILPARGHFYGSLKMLQMLKDVGYNVVFLNMESIKAELTKYGFQTSYSTSFNVPPILLKKQKFNFKLFADGLLTNRKERENNEKVNFQSFVRLLIELNPDLVLLDEQNMLKAVYYELLGIPVVCIETKPEPGVNINVPPFTSSFVPSDTKLSRLYCSWLWIIKISKNYLRLKKKQFNNLGQDDYSLALKIAKQNGHNLRSRIDLKRSYGIGIIGIPRLILSPVDFDFSNIEKVNTYRIGPLIDMKREGEIVKPRYTSLLKKLQLIKASKEGKVIYCSMGTINAQFSKRVTKFFIKTLHVAQLNPNDLFILSIGKHIDVSQLIPSPHNVYIFETVPQIDLLKYCDIMITHGGINSITECVFHGIPTLNYPLSYEWDQPGCAARVDYHRIGLKGKINCDSVKVISKKLNKLKSNYDWYRKNVISMREKFESKNQSGQVLAIIQNILQGN